MTLCFLFGQWSAEAGEEGEAQHQEEEGDHDESEEDEEQAAERRKVELQVSQRNDSFLSFLCTEM